MSEQVNHPAHYGGADNVYETVKQCSSCKGRKRLEDFGPDSRRRDGRAAKCRACARAVAIAHYSTYPEKEAARRVKNAEAGARWHLQNRDKRVRRMRWARVLRLYGLTEAMYAAMLGAQGGRCDICRSDDPGRNDNHFCIDHCHATGAVRGLLCQRCNSGIGFFSECPRQLRKAADYVERYKRQPDHATALHKPES